MANFFAVADVYCNTLLACERAGDIERVEQWCRVVSDFAQRRNASPIFPFCHVTYGGLLTAAGRWAEAEEELRLAIETFDAGHRGMKVLAIGRLADLRIRQGRIEEARQLIAGYEDHPLALRPMARLHTPVKRRWPRPRWSAGSPTPDTTRCWQPPCWRCWWTSGSRWAMPRERRPSRPSWLRWPSAPGSGR